MQPRCVRRHLQSSLRRSRARPVQTVRSGAPFSKPQGLPLCSDKQTISEPIQTSLRARRRHSPIGPCSSDIVKAFRPALGGHWGTIVHYEDSLVAIDL
jgi:hypothetical protein